MSNDNPIIRQTVDEIVAATHGPFVPPVQPEGGSEIIPLTGHHTARPFAEVAPGSPSPAQGAGAQGSSLTPAKIRARYVFVCDIWNTKTDLGQAR